jgi:hypothetical protein
MKQLNLKKRGGEKNVDYLNEPEKYLESISQRNCEELYGR